MKTKKSYRMSNLTLARVEDISKEYGMTQTEVFEYSVALTELIMLSELDSRVISMILPNGRKVQIIPVIELGDDLED